MLASFARKQIILNGSLNLLTARIDASCSPLSYGLLAKGVPALWSTALWAMVPALWSTALWAMGVPALWSTALWATAFWSV